MAASAVVNPSSQPLYCCWRTQGEKTKIFFLPQNRACLHANPSTKLWSSSSSSSSFSSRKRNLHVIRANTGVDFGARDPFPAEIESNFSDKVLGCWDTEHVILVPNAPALSLCEQSCIHPLPESIRPFFLDEAKALLRKVVGWRLLEEESVLKLQCEWKLKDHASALELITRLTQVSESEKKPVILNLDDATHMLRAEIWTESLGGLCLNDFILAAKIDQVKTTDLIKRNKFWA